MIEYTNHFLLALPLNILVEGTILILFIRKAFCIPEHNISTSYLAVVSVFANMATLPYVWYIFPVLIYRSYSTAVGVGEVFAFLIEGLSYYFFLRISPKRSAAVSFVANATSFLFVSFLLRVMFSA